MTIILIDLDHCLTDARGRDHLIPAQDWDAYHSAAGDDPPVQAIVNLIGWLPPSDEGGPQVWGVTGRNEKWRSLTNQWLLRHGVWLDELLMRPDDDFTPAHELKVRLIRERLPSHDDSALRRDIALVLDDNEAVLSAFAAIGITTCRVSIS